MTDDNQQMIPCGGGRGKPFPLPGGEALRPGKRRAIQARQQTQRVNARSRSGVFTICKTAPREGRRSSVKHVRTFQVRRLQRTITVYISRGGIQNRFSLVRRSSKATQFFRARGATPTNPHLHTTSTFPSFGDVEFWNEREGCMPWHVRFQQWIASPRDSALKRRLP